VTNERLAEIKALRSAITATPWQVGGMGDTIESIAKQENGCTVADWLIADMVGEANGFFIAAAPALVDELLAEVARLTQQNEGLYQAVLMGRAEQERLRQQVAFFEPYGDLICDMIAASEDPTKGPILD
jgi:hypothetical protein